MNTYLVLAVLASVVVMATAQCSSHANGCSIPYHLPFLFKSKFTSSCNKHDVCYACAPHYGKTKSDCDLMLYHEANRVCGQRKRFLVTLTSAEQNFCKLISGVYYEAVAHFGNSHYPGRAASWCSQSWVRSCLP